MGDKVDTYTASKLLGISRATLYQQYHRRSGAGAKFKPNAHGLLEADFDELLKEAKERYKGPAREQKIGVRFSDAELEKLKEVAGDTPLATYIRQTVTRRWDDAQ